MKKGIPDSGEKQSKCIPRALNALDFSPGNIGLNLSRFIGNGRGPVTDLELYLTAVDVAHRTAETAKKQQPKYDEEALRWHFTAVAINILERARAQMICQEREVS